MTINDYLAYVDYFNSRRYDDYYTEDVIVELPSSRLQGKQAVREFYQDMNDYVHETIRVKKVLMDADTLIANIWSDFYCHRDREDFVLGPVRRGDLLRVELVVLYTLRDNRFSHIRAGRLSQPA